MNDGFSGKEQKFRWSFFLSGIMLIVACVLVILFFLHGDTTVTKVENNIETMQSLVCEGHGIPYPFFLYDNAKDKSLKISAIFDDDKLNEISFVYRLSYDNSLQVKESEARNHAALGTSFGRDSLSVDALDVNFSILENVMQMSLYTEVGDMDVVKSKYFLLEDANGAYGIDDVVKIYTNKGLDCVSR